MIDKRTEEPGLKKRAVSGLKWLTAGRLMGQTINWALTFVVMRILSPSDYGLMAMASMFVAVLTLFNEMGMGTALVQAKEVSRQVIRQVFGLTILVNFSLASILFFSAPVVAGFFGEDQLSLMVRVLSFQFVIMAFMILPQAMLDREMAFKQKSMIDLGANIISGAVSLALALAGHGVWSLVWAAMVLVGLKTIGYHWAASCACLPSFSFAGMGQVLKFGTQVTAEKLIWYLYSQADTLIIGKLLGKELLGFYTVGKHVASLPLDKIMPIFNQVILTTFSKIQHDVRRVGRYTMEILGMVALAAFPVFWGLSAVAPELLGVVLGEKWAEAALPLTLVSMAFPLRMLNSVIASVLKSQGRSGRSLFNQCIYFCIMVPGFVLGSFNGILGVCMIWTFGFPLCFGLTVMISSSKIGMTPGQVWAALIRPLTYAAIMTGLVHGARTVMPVFLPEVIRLMVYVLAGALFYCGAQFLFNRPELKRMKALIQA